MALSTDALTTLAALKQYLGLASTDHDSLLEGLIDAVSKYFNTYCGRNLTARDYSPEPADAAYDPDNAVLDGQGYAELLLPQYPVVSITSLAVEGAAPAWQVDRAAGVLALTNGVFPRGRQNVRVAYRAGFAAVPADLAQAALEQAAVRFQESSAGHGRLGVAARTLADGSTSYTTSDLLPQVRAVLDRYRNRSLL